MSTAMVMGPERSCSGLAYSMVKVRKDWVNSEAWVWPWPAADRMSFAMPKSSSLGTPSAVTRMLRGLISRCTMRARWAYWTAAQT